MKQIYYDYKRYNREEIHNIFSPHTTFTPQSGTWGLHGLVRIENSNDFVFIVTLGTIQSGHTFDEGFTEDGVFRWQSQPRNTFKTPNIIKLINHDETENTISLFMRENINSYISALILEGFTVSQTLPIDSLKLFYNGLTERIKKT